MTCHGCIHDRGGCTVGMCAPVRWEMLAQGVPHRLLPPYRGQRLPERINANVFREEG